MPKTSKKSKASKSTGLKKKFDLSSKKVQFFVVIAIVALLGGGWFTYKSFAASNYLLGFNQLKCDQPVPTCTGGTDSETVNGQKNTFSILILNAKGASISNGVNFLMRGVEHYKFCVTAKGTGYVKFAFLQSELFSKSEWTNDVAITNANAYATYCTSKSFTVPGAYPEDQYLPKLSVRHIGGNPIKVKTVSIKNVTPTTK